jgi:hypothetical protein
MGKYRGELGKISVEEHTDEGSVQIAKHGELKQSSQEAPFEASKHVASLQTAEVSFVV